MEPGAGVDLDAYFARIGYDGARRADLHTLRALHCLHPQKIAFENLNPLLRWPVRLDAASLQDKLVEGGRGGYCFEHNLLLLHVLQGLGYTVHGLAARVLWGLPDDAVRPRSHMLLAIELDHEDWIADVGFGGQTITAPLRLQADVEQPTPHGPARLRALDGGYVLQSLLAGEWKPLYRFDLQPQHVVDYEVASWYLTSHPSSHFLTSLIAARAAPDGRHALLDNALAWHPMDGASERRTVDSVDALHGVLADVFGIALPRTSQVDAALASVLRRSE